MEKIFVLGVSLDDQIFENAWMLFFGLSKHFFKSTNQIRLGDQSIGGWRIYWPMEGGVPKTMGFAKKDSGWFSPMDPQNVWCIFARFFQADLY